MSKIETLKLNYEFKNVFDKGKYFIGNQIIIYYYKNKFDYNRIGIAVSSKLCNAVNRNHLKRLIREAYRSSELIKLSGYDIVFTWNKKCDYKNANYNELINEMNNLKIK